MSSFSYLVIKWTPAVWLVGAMHVGRLAGGGDSNEYGDGHIDCKNWLVIPASWAN